MKRIRKILVPVDFSLGSAAAWETARMLVNTMSATSRSSCSMSGKARSRSFPT